MSKQKRSHLVLGYTRTGRAVMSPLQAAPSLTTTDVLYRNFADWTRGDHLDTSHILAENSERASDPNYRSWCTSWARLHRDIGRGRVRIARAPIRGATETLLRPSHRRRPGSKRRH